MVETMSTEQAWADVKSQLAVGQIVEGRVMAHWQFGIFVSFDHQFIGLVEIPYFKEKGERMTAKEYPDIGEPIRAVVVGFNDRNHQIALSARPSDLAKVKPAK